MATDGASEAQSHGGVQSLARAFAPGVRVCAVAPGPVLLPDGSDGERGARQAARTPSALLLHEE